MNKDGSSATGINGRKASVSQGASNAFGVSSPSSATRPGTRRRETSDANPFSLASPTATGRAGRDDATWLPRRGTEKEPEQQEDDTSSMISSRVPAPFGNLMRSNTAGTPNMSSLWGNSQPSTPSTTGAFGGGGFGNFALGAPIGPEKKLAPGASRLAHLMPKDGEGGSGRPGEGQGALNQSSWRSRQRTDTDPFGEDMPSGSAALGGSTEADFAPQQGRAGTLGTPVKGSTGDFGMSGLHLGDDGPGSPSETNPYRSPPADRPHDDENGTSRQYVGLPQDVPSGYNPLQRAFTEGQDRSQTSSASRGFPMGNMSAWAAPGGPTAGTPDRERSNIGAGPFSPALFNSTDNIQSPSIGNLSSFFGPGTSAGGMGTNSIGRGSKLSSMFPAAMQAQMQQSQTEHDMLGDATNDPRFPSQLGAIGRNNFPPREAESPMRSGRGAMIEDLFQQHERGAFGAGTAQGTPGAPGSFTPISGPMPYDGNSVPPATDSNQPRIMVMPDRMRWVYLDPQQNVQGPFTGLEMNDWYKANFFTPDLRVKRSEDPEFEPLGQLIRRIGNSREPFLVPQWGVAYGAPMPPGENPTANSGGQVVPPLSTVFPSFGRTLTADEQNNLERRKQEEQYILAQQREFALRQQAVGRFPGQQPGLQHHSSAQSLQSQPSFGSIQSPIGGMQGHIPQGQYGGVPPSGGNTGSFFDAVGEGRANLTQGADIPLGEDELAHLSQNERSIFAALQEQHEQQQASAAAEEMNFRAGLPEVDQLGPDAEGFKERLQEFNSLRAERDAHDAAQAEQQLEEPQLAEESTPRPSGPARISKSKKSKKMIPLVHDDDDSLSLTQQVQQTQAAVAASAAQTVVEPDMPMPFPPPSSSTPLPAPTAQRVRSNLPEQYNRSQSGSPEDDAAPAEPPPMAPWAKEASNEASKGPSLKEIQEAEARKAAQAEETASALRKAALEQEAVLLREREKQAAATAAGLPASSTWGHTASPVSSGSPWTKPAAVKAPAPGLSQPTSSISKKTLAEIQAEEERRKQKAKDVVIQTSAPAPSSKSYANLAGKPGQPFPSGPAAGVAPPPGAGWATVGAGGKVKAPIGPGSTPRSASVTQPKPSPASLKPISRPGPAAQVSAPNTTALEDFRKWVTRELARGLSIADCMSFPPLPLWTITNWWQMTVSVSPSRHFPWTPPSSRTLFTPTRLSWTAVTSPTNTFAARSSPIGASQRKPRRPTNQRRHPVLAAGARSPRRRPARLPMLPLQAQDPRRRQHQASRSWPARRRARNRKGSPILMTARRRMERDMGL